MKVGQYVYYVDGSPYSKGVQILKRKVIKVTSRRTYQGSKYNLFQIKLQNEDGEWRNTQFSTPFDTKKDGPIFLTEKAAIKYILKVVKSKETEYQETLKYTNIFLEELQEIKQKFIPKNKRI